MHLTYASEPYLAYDKYEFVQHALEKHPRADGAIPVQELEEEAAAAESDPPATQNLSAADTSGYVEPAVSGKSPRIIIREKFPLKKIVGKSFPHAEGATN